jgi:hypothetical protein
MAEDQNVRKMRHVPTRAAPNPVICGTFCEPVRNLRHLRGAALQAVVAGGWMPPLRR